MRHQISRELYAYWDRLRRDRPAPDRTELDLLAIRSMLADTFILEEGPDGSYPLRISGTRVDSIWGRDRKGMCFTQLWRPSDKFAIETALTNVVDGALPIVGGARVQAPGDALLALEFLLLPLRHFSRGSSRILGALTPLHPVDWLGQASAGPLEIISTRLVDPSLARARHMPQARPRLIVHNGGKI